MKVFFRIAIYIFILFALWILLAWGMANFLVVERPLEKADAIVVLSGAAQYEERTHEAAAIFKKGVAPKILLTNDGLRGGWVQNIQENPYFVERARWELIAQGVPEDAIEVLPAVVGGTCDEARVIIDAAMQKGLTSLLIVTSPSHSRRTLYTFERTQAATSPALDFGIKFSGDGRENSASFTWWICRDGWNNVGLEYVKIVYYWIYC